MPGRRQGLDPQTADLGGTGLDRQAELALVLDVVGMRVGPQDYLGLDPPALGRLPQRLERRAGSTYRAAPPSSSATR